MDEASVFGPCWAGAGVVILGGAFVKVESREYVWLWSLKSHSNNASVASSTSEKAVFAELLRLTNACLFAFVATDIFETVWMWIHTESCYIPHLQLKPRCFLLPVSRSDSGSHLP